MKKILIITGIICTLLSSGCSSNTINRKIYSSYTPQYSSWEDIVQHPQSEITVDVWNTGQILCPVSGLVNMKHKNAPHVAEKKRFVDVPAFYITSKQHGNFLIDTGLDTSMRTDPFKNISGIVARFILPEVRQQKGQSVGERLTNKPTLSGIFFTHLHFDHIAGLADLNVTYPVVVGQHETEVRYPFLFETNHLETIPSIYELDFSQGKALPPFENVIDIFGDNSLFAIDTNGHTNGHVSFLINSTSGLYLITGDQVNIKENVESMVGPGSYSTDVDKGQHSFNQLITFKNSYPQTRLLLGHEVF